ncbi:MAG TPA: hypothetical protein VGX25_04140 [Actinophytocola sp.]|uniref:hypothetical protein n=1 Tax=Actinophytocola sp. TaxID=1872138 RepID=UPI002DDDA72E|nr:hypothetical protein [Actinophytocola sp.]HEV2778569.1 hypothetical protein [Actinophytocola sp.]
MNRLAEVLRWPWWTVATARHRLDALTTDRPDWTPAELAQLPHVRHPEQRLNNEDAADRHDLIVGLADHAGNTEGDT